MVFFINIPNKPSLNYFISPIDPNYCNSRKIAQISFGYKNKFIARKNSDCNLIDYK